MWFLGRRGLEERLSTTQILLQQQEEMVRRGERERRSLTDKVKDLERALQTCEADKKNTQVHTRLFSCVYLFKHHVFIHCDSPSNDRWFARATIWQLSTVEQYLEAKAVRERNNNRCHIHTVLHLLSCLMLVLHMSVFYASTFQNNSLSTQQEEQEHKLKVRFLMGKGA